MMLFEATLNSTIPIPNTILINTTINITLPKYAVVDILITLSLDTNPDENINPDKDMSVSISPNVVINPAIALDWFRLSCWWNLVNSVIPTWINIQDL